MLKALFKKQFMELFRAYFVSRKNGKVRSRGQTIGFFALFAVLIVYLGFMCFGMAFALGSALIPLGMDWLYFSLMGTMAILLGVFGSVFNTYTGLYRAKDNDFLISMPIPPRWIVIVRLSGVFGLSLLYSAVIWVPTLLYYFLFAAPGTPAVIFGVLLWPLIAAFVTVLTCALGWVVALVSSKISSKSFVTVALSVVLLGAYYFFCFRMREFFTAMVENVDAVGGFMRVWFNFLYQMGQAATGNVLGMLIFAGVTVLLGYLCLWLMARTFISLATQSAAGAGSKTRKAKALKSHTPRAALLRREFKRFGASAAYMLNCGLGVMFMLAIAVFALIQQDTLQRGLGQAAAEMPWLPPMLPLLAASITCGMASINVISTPSVSLEGKRLWILQSLPIAPAEVLKAKLWLHVLINGIAASLTTGVLCFCVRTDWLGAVLAVAYAAAYVWLTGVIGLMLGLKRPNLHWTVETQPIKQDLTVLLSLLLGLVIVLPAPIAYFVLIPLRPESRLFLLLFVLLLGGIAFALTRWLTRTGARLLTELS